MNRTLLRLVAIVPGLLAGCAHEPPSPPPTPSLEAEIKAYYAAHASEKNGRCLRPYIDGFSGLQMVDEAPGRTVVDARYFFRDWHKDGGDNQMANPCVGFGERSFTLAANGNQLEVTGMSGPRRN